MKYIPLGLVLVGGFLRFEFLTEPLWIDEVLFYNFIANGSLQDFIPVWFFQVYGLFFDISNPFFLRLPFVLAGLGCVWAIWDCFEDKYVKTFSAAMMACFPLFVYWSAIARVYPFAWLFMILAFKRQWFSVPLILTTPLGLVGLNFFKGKERWGLYFGCAVLGVVMFLIRPDSGRNFLAWEFLSHAKRIWSLVIVSGLLHICQYIDAFRMGERIRFKKV